MPLLNQEEASRLFSVLNSGRERSLDSVTEAFSRAFAPTDAVKVLTCVVLLLKVNRLSNLGLGQCRSVGLDHVVSANCRSTQFYSCQRGWQLIFFCGKLAEICH